MFLFDARWGQVEHGRVINSGANMEGKLANWLRQIGIQMPIEWHNIAPTLQAHYKQNKERFAAIKKDESATNTAAKDDDE